jgi:penicillin-binding protein 1A
LNLSAGRPLGQGQMTDAAFNIDTPGPGPMRARPPAPHRPPPDDRDSRVILAALIGLALAVMLFMAVIPVTNPFNPLNQPAVVLVTNDGQTLARAGAYRDVPVKVQQLPPYVPLAFIAIEDRHFLRHHGVDVGGVFRAALANLRAHHVVQGGSTITQQLVKNAYLDQRRTLGRKAKEALLAVWLEMRMSKAEIMSAYLSSVYFGDGVYGLRAASTHYFGKKPEQLTLGEAALLAGLVKSPSRLNPAAHPAAAGRRARVVLNAMADQHFISRARSRTAGHVKIVLQKTETTPGAYFADWVTKEALADARAHGDGGRVQTTLDMRMQKTAEEIVRRMLPSRGARQAALVAMTPDGAIRAMVGGRDYAASQFNRAARAERQPGSAFKLFVYDAAMRAGHHPDEMIENSPVTVGKWSPGNFGDRYSGPITLMQAFAHSSNVAAVRLTMDVGPETVASAARRLGVTSPIGHDPSIALGTSEVNLLELTAAYAAFVKGRGPVKPYGVQSDRPRHLGLVMTPQERFNMLVLLSSVVQGGTGRQAALKVPSFGKTGTAQDSRDAWFIGFTGDLVVGVWVGNDNHSPTHGIVGGALPAQIWRAFMTGVGYQGAPVPPSTEIESEGETLQAGPPAGAEDQGEAPQLDEDELAPDEVVRPDEDQGGPPMIIVPPRPQAPPWEDDGYGPPPPRFRGPPPPDEGPPPDEPGGDQGMPQY